MTLKRSTMASLLVLLVATPALAQSPPPPATDSTPPAAERGRLAACRDDIASYCKSAEAGRGRIIACLADNQAKLSAACAAVVQERQARAGKGNAAATPPPANATAELATPDAKAKGKGGNRLAACRTEVASFCQSVQAGGGARVKCLREHQAELSPACSEALSTLPERTGKGKT